MRHDTNTHELGNRAQRSDSDLVISGEEPKVVGTPRCGVRGQRGALSLPTRAAARTTRAFKFPGSSYL